MTRLLIVDDDPNQVRILARVFAARDPGLSVLTANSGDEAIVVLRSMPVDLVLTDLQMPDLNGFDLVAWLVAHQPHVQAFTMTAYPDDEAVERLRGLGSADCYTKPLDVASVLERLSESLSHGMRGHIRNISLPSLLQLIEMERKTCTLTVESEGRTGYVYLSEGALFDARWNDLDGDAAAIQVSAWASPSVTIINGCASHRKTIQGSLNFLLMEAMRLMDEQSEAAPTGTHSISLSVPPEGPWAGPGCKPHLSQFPVRPPAQAEAIAIVDTRTGQLLTSNGRFEGLSELAELIAELHTNTSASIARLHIEEAVEELVMTTARFWIIARPLPTEPHGLAMLVFDPEQASMVMERIELDEFVGSVEAWMR